MTSQQQFLHAIQQAASVLFPARGTPVEQSAARVAAGQDPISGTSVDVSRSHGSVNA